MIYIYFTGGGWRMYPFNLLLSAPAYMGVGRIFSSGMQQDIFQKFFPGGPKVVKFVFYPSKLKKTTFF